MNARFRIKAAAFVVGLLVVAGSAALGHRRLALAIAASVFAWLLFETRRRTRFRFSEGPVREETFTLAQEAVDLVCGASAVFVHPRGALSVHRFGSGCASLLSLEGSPLAVLPLEQGRLLCAHEDRLSLCDARGREQKALAFEPALMRQSYRLLAAADGSRGALVTPWFAQVFDLSLEHLRGRVRFEDAGHYFKYAALGSSGRGLLLAGACLLPEEEGGALEARWDWWEQGQGGVWDRRWARARESYENSQVRGVQVGGDGGVLCTEVWREGYAFELRGADGGLLWERPGGERPVLSPSGAKVVFELPGQVLVVGDSDGRERWRWTHRERLRLKRVLDDGSCLVLEGRCLRRFGPGGVQAPEIWLKNDAEHLSMGLGGRLVLAGGRKGACLRLEGGF